MKIKNINEWGEEISEEFIDYAAKKIRKLSKKEIDELWAKTGWKEERCEPNKSLPNWRLKEIKEDSATAKANLRTFFLETPKNEFIKLFLSIPISDYFINQGKPPERP